MIGLLAGLVPSCTQSSQERVSFDLFVQGTETRTMVLADGTELILERADLAFGPLYLCPGTQAGALCDSARLEWTESVVVDALDPARQDAGKVSGVTGPVRSYMYDLGYVSLLTTDELQMQEAADELGASLVLSGTAILQNDSAPLEVPFFIAVVVSQSEDTEQGQPVVRKSASGFFEHEVDRSTTGLTLRFDPAPWAQSLSGVDFRDHVRCTDAQGMGGVGGDTSTTGMAGASISLGGAANAAECEVRFDSGSAAHRALRQALMVGRRPDFVWEQ